MRVAVVGASGFIGARLTRYLAGITDTTVVAVARVQPADLAFGVEFRPLPHGASAQQMRAHFRDVDAVVYAAGNAVPRTFEVERYAAFEAETAALANFVDALPTNRSIRFVFLSSGGTIYGESQHGAHREQDRPTPTGFYGASKLACEGLLFAHAKRSQLTPIVLRLSNCYGPGQLPHRGQGVVAAFGAALLADAPIEIWGTGHAVRDFVYVDDAVEAIALAIRYGGGERIFNIGSAVGVSVNQLLDMLSTAITAKPQVRYIGTDVGTVEANVLANSLAQSELGWTPKTTLEEGLRNTLRWLRDQSGRRV
jgi:UDP-glucose 4-epimerase